MKNKEIIMSLNNVLMDFCYDGCLDNIKIYFSVSNETVASIRNRLRKANDDVMSNYVLAIDKTDDKTATFLECFDKFYWQTFEKVLDSLLRKEGGDIDKDFIEGEFENEKNRLLEQVVEILK